MLKNCREIQLIVQCTTLMEKLLESNILILQMEFFHIRCKFHIKAGVAPGIFRQGADSSDEGAKIWFSGYYKG